jgi:hypothetical protein
MSLTVVLILTLLLVALIALPLGKRTKVEQLINELDRNEDEDELAEAEEEVRNLDAMATPEEADQHLPDWGPGVPRKKKR